MAIVIFECWGDTPTGFERGFTKTHEEAEAQVAHLYDARIAIISVSTKDDLIALLQNAQINSK